MNKSRLFAASLLSVCFALLFTSPVIAQTDQRLDITVNPPVIELNSKPGSVISDRFRVRNNSKTSIKISIGLYKLAPGLENQVSPQKISPEDEFADWIKIDPPTLEALPGEWQDINYTIEIPNSAAFGYYFAFRIGLADFKPNAVQGANLNGEVIIPTLLTVKKDGLKASATLLSFKTPLINEYLPITFVANIQNNGNVHVKPRGNIFIRSSHNQDVAVLEINQGLGSVLPNTERGFDSSWDEGFFVNKPILEDGKPVLDKAGKPKTKLTINWDQLTKFRLGKYTADLLMVYDDGTRDIPLTKTISFWVVPYKLFLTIFFSIVFFILTIQFLIKIYIQKELAKNKR